MFPYTYTIYHIPGADNVWADLMSRWGASNNHRLLSIRIPALFAAPIAPDLDPDFTWPSADEICQLQNSAAEKGGETVPGNPNGRGFGNHRAWCNLDTFLCDTNANQNLYCWPLRTWWTPRH